MTKRKAPAAETGINPKLAALAAKLDEAHAHVSIISDLLDGKPTVSEEVGASYAKATS